MIDGEKKLIQKYVGYVFILRFLHISICRLGYYVGKLF